MTPDKEITEQELQALQFFLAEQILAHKDSIEKVSNLMLNMVAAVIGGCARDEFEVLDGINAASKQMRTVACDTFVRRQNERAASRKA